MSQADFDTHMSEVADAFAEERYDDAFAAARELRQGLVSVARATSMSPDPLQLGWARFYEFNCLYEMEDYRAAFHLLETAEPFVWIVSESNAAWMFSLGSELAMRLERAEDVVSYGERCYELRKDSRALLECANNICIMLHHLKRDDLSRPWAERLIVNARARGDRQAVRDGIGFLLDHADCSGVGDLADRLNADRTELQGWLADEACQGEPNDEADEGLTSRTVERIDRVLAST